MQWERPLIKAKLLKRYKRFFADVEIEGKVVTAHCPNTGTLRSCLFEGGECYVSFNDDPARKLKYTLEVTVSPEGAWIGINTQRPNQLVKEVLADRKNQSWNRFPYWRGEVAISKETRFDFGLSHIELPKAQPKTFTEYDHYIEVKNVTLRDGNGALFPDTESTRAQKHLIEMMALLERGKSAEVVFTVQRNDVEWFSPAAQFDPEYAELLGTAKKQGLIVSPYFVDLDINGIQLSSRMLPMR